MIHHSNTTCDDCGERHTPGAQSECIEILKARAEDCADQAQRIADLEAELAERTKERDAERAVRETAEKEAHQHAERQAELYQERDALEEENDALKAKLCVVVAEIDATRHERDALAQKVRDLSDPS